METFDRMELIIIRAGLYALQAGEYNNPEAKERLEKLINKTFDVEISPEVRNA